MSLDTEKRPAEVGVQAPSIGHSLHVVLGAQPASLFVVLANTYIASEITTLCDVVSPIRNGRGYLEQCQRRPARASPAAAPR